LHIIAALIGIAIGVIFWVITSPWVVLTIFWVEQRYPQVVGTRAIRISEAVVCGLQVFACLGSAFWIALLMVG
jgi:hypothetical protein